MTGNSIVYRNSMWDPILKKYFPCGEIWDRWSCIYIWNTICQPDEIRVPTEKPGWAASELIPLTPTTLLRKPPSKNTLLIQVCGMETRQFQSVQILKLMEQQCMACKQHQAVKDLRDRGGHWEIQVQGLCLAMKNWSFKFEKFIEIEEHCYWQRCDFVIKFCWGHPWEIYWQSRKLQE